MIGDGKRLVARSVASALVAALLCGCGGGHGISSLPHAFGKANGAKRSPKSAGGCTSTQARGTITTHSLPSSGAGPYGIGVSGDTVWVAEPLVNKVAKYQNGSFQEYTSPTSSSSPYGLAIGSDGLPYFTETTTSNKIGRVNADGTISEFSDGGGSQSFPSEIAAAPDGTLWATTGANSTTKLANITTSGSITMNGAGTATDLWPEGVTADSSGTVWWADNGSYSRIGKRTSSGTVTLYTTPTSNSMPQEITVGPDGRIWFSELHVSKIGALDPATGTISEYSVPNDAHPNGIVAACGYIWFAETSNNQIGMMSTDGTLVAEYLVPGSGPIAPKLLAVGPDGNIWFSNTNANSIGKIITSGT